jgi:membrane associated rhomboid family serine protease
MYEVPSPTHGFFGVTVAFLAYVGLVIGVAAGLSTLGLSRGVAIAGSVVAAAGLLVVFVPLFRRLTPTGDGDG